MSANGRCWPCAATAAAAAAAAVAAGLFILDPCPFGADVAATAPAAAAAATAGASLSDLDPVPSRGMAAQPDSAREKIATIAATGAKRTSIINSSYRNTGGPSTASDAVNINSSLVSVPQRARRGANEAARR